MAKHYFTTNEFELAKAMFEDRIPLEMKGFGGFGEKTGEVISFALEGNADAGFTYEGTHMQEVADNKIREVNNGLILLGSPIYTIKPGETEVIENMTFVTEVTAA